MTLTRDVPFVWLVSDVTYVLTARVEQMLQEISEESAVSLQTAWQCV